MTSLIKQSSTQLALKFIMVQSSDHITGLTGASPTVTICKEGGAFASPAGAVTEIANGWYQVAGNATDTDTLGNILLHATAASGDPTDIVAALVVGFDPQAALATPTNITSATGITVSTNSDKTGYALTSGERNSVADALLDRDMSTGADSGSTTVRTVRQALRFLRNKWAVSGTTLTVYKEDDATSSWTGTVSQDATANPITGNDPAGP